MTEDEVVGWHHRLNGHELEQAQGDAKAHLSLQHTQGSPVCAVHRVSKSQTRLRNRTTTIACYYGVISLSFSFLHTAWPPWEVQ